ncbi:hypothetical protein C0Q70_11917 [Pomacea canaliculata]|uniref:C-type lectin domain-containing protein n=1 Tax=Pomacea canaliculata TaxID=400727 RepID=A0A2T7P7B9_POMCA|nr:hypothetical protein C0Q70_11917 [Pomacea canaliculata]
MCRLLSANLVEITSKEESDFISRFLSGHSAISTWIGATDIFSEGKFVWMPEGEPVNFTNWAPGEPNHNTGTGSEDCVILDENRSWHWNDIACTTAAYFVCEMSMSTPTLPANERQDQATTTAMTAVNIISLNSVS